MFNPKKKIIIETDISRIALGAILSQLDKKDRLYPIIFYSKKFTVTRWYGSCLGRRGSKGALSIT